MRTLLGLVALFAGFTGSFAFASPCGIAPLTTYEALGGSGCTLGTLTVKNFNYSQLSGTVTIPDSTITVTPTTGPGMVALEFSSPSFNLGGADFSRYLLTYRWDPADIRSLEDVMNANSPVAPGTAQVTTDACADGVFGVGCPIATPTGTVKVFDFGTSSQLSDTFPFANPCPPLSSCVHTVDLRNTIELFANGASSEFTSFTNILHTIPEPGTMTVGALGLLLVGLRLKFRQARF